VSGARGAPQVPIACFWGNDTWALDRAAERFGRLLDAADAPLERWRTRGDATSTPELAERLGTAPLFGGGTLVVVRETMPLLRTAESRDALLALLGSVAPGNGLVLLFPLDGSGRAPAGLDKVRAAVEAAGGTTREHAAPKPAELPAWIETRAEELGVRLGRGVAREIAERVGGLVKENDIDRRGQSQLVVGELEKLRLYRPEGEVSVEDVRALMPEAVPASTWAFLDAVANRTTRSAIELLGPILEASAEPVVVVQLHRRLRELLEILARLEEGETPQSLPRSMGLHPYRAQMLVASAGRWTPDELERALDGLLELDVAGKGADGRIGTEAQRRLRFTLWLTSRVAAG
jgi:DNA polymerase-3 subunit delta